MVFGIGEGKVAITLAKTIFAPGETIRGKARLEIDVPKQARALRLELYREEQRRTSHMGAGGATHHSSSRQKTVEFSKPLGGEKLYTPGEEYEFELAAPSGTAALNLPASPISGIVSALAAYALPVPRYYVAVVLDLPMSKDISGRAQIQIQAPAQPAQNAQPQGSPGVQDAQQNVA